MKKTTSFYYALYTLALFFSANVFAQADQPPVVTAAGNQVYCPGSSANIVQSFTITDPDDTGTNAIYIQISSGYVLGQDQLGLSSPIPNVFASWNATAGKLTLSGVGGQELLYTTLINAVNNVVYTSSAANPTGTRTFSITVGEANYLPSNGHYYRFISQPNITWTASKTAAENSNYYGLQGYLATLLSADEAQLCGEQSSGNGWIGGSDSQNEGVWRWMTGPEAGIIFWNGGINGSSPNFAKWNTNEPNNQGEEDYAHITAAGLGIPGSWNDLPNGGGSGGYQAQGYIVEYGGMPGDPVLQISGSTTITMPVVTATTPAARCDTGTVTLGATVTTGSTPHWYAAATGGTPLATGNSFTTPVITQTTTYYVSAFDETCTATRTAVLATINPLPELGAITNVSTCQGSPAELNAFSANATIRWYTQATGGTHIATGNIFTTPPITANTTYYVEAINPQGCISAREPVTITVNPQPTVTSANPAISICGSGTAQLQATASSGTINWYDAATGGALAGTGTTITSPIITATTTFYAEAVNGGCASAARQPVTVTVVTAPTILSITNDDICTQGSTVISAVPSSGTVNWYDALTGGTLLYTGNNFTTPVLNASQDGTTYYAEAVTPEGCIQAVRTGVAINVVEELQVLTIANPVTACEGTPFLLEATPNQGQVYWYDAPTGGNQVAVGNNTAFNNSNNLTAVYAEVVYNNCVSPVRVQANLIQYALPQAGIDRDLEFCEGTSLTLDAAVTGVTYVWSTGATTQTITVTTPGQYEVELTNASGCSDTQVFTIEMLDAPQIANVQFTNSSATIIMVNPDLENFEYSLDGVHYQASPTFTNLAAGQYTGYARSIIGCGTDEEDFVIYLIPKVISPNGDTINDVFTIAGISALPKAEVVIMDRYGKLLTQLNRTNPRWDGTVNGYPVPATDYWYVIKIDDQTPEIRGHFALIR